MDLVPLIDHIGEPAAAAVIGAALGAAFGAFALVTNFCTRSAVIDIFKGSNKHSLALWLVAFSVAVGGTQLLLANGLLAVGETRFFSTAQSISGAVIGGAIFGIGMVLTRGCVSRLLVLSASGNLRALFSLAIIAITAWATIGGPLVPIREAISPLLMSSVLGTNDLAAVSGGGSIFGLLTGAILIAIAAVAVISLRLPVPKVLGGLAIGAILPTGWYLTHQLSLQVFEPIQAESLSFIRPLSTSLDYVASAGAEQYLGFDVGILAGTLAGALITAALTGRFRIRTFSEPGTPHIGRYVVGSALMGVGGVLAVGCTIGAGFTGGSVLAITSLIGLGAMLTSAAIAHWALEIRTAQPDAIVVPAE